MKKKSMVDYDEVDWMNHNAKGKWYYCGCYSLTASGKKVYLKSNVDYSKEHPKHTPRCIYKETKA